MLGCPYGSHRVIEPEGVLPQAAWKVSNDTSTLYDNEIMIDVEALNIDSASFRQMAEAAGGVAQAPSPAAYPSPFQGEGAAATHGVADRIAEMILKTVAERGKQHNPVTNSGGMLIGRVARIGPALLGRYDVAEGDDVATLVSLSLTPLRIDRIKAVHPEIDRVDIEGQAILFERTALVRLPADMPRTMALAILDVAGAAPQTHRLVKPGQAVLILGAGGKSGMLCAAAARQGLGPAGRVIGAGHSHRSTERIRGLGLCDVVLQVDAQRPLEVEAKAREATGGRMADLTINCTNAADTEMASILATREGGTVYFFNMATSFARAALGAEGIARDVTLVIGNGYAAGHAGFSLELVRRSPALRRVFEEMYG